MRNYPGIIHLPCLDVGLSVNDVDFRLASFIPSGHGNHLPRCRDGNINWSTKECKLTAIEPEQLIPVVAGQAVEVLRLDLRAVTANLQSGLEKIHFIEQQLIAQGVGCAFFQEVKGGEGLIRSKAFLRYNSESHAIWGCSVWLSRLLPLGSYDGRNVFVDESEVSVISACPRSMVLRLRTPTASIYLAALHRPSQLRPQHEREAFDERLRGIVEQTQGQPLIVGIDANARVPLSVEGITGSLECGPSDKAGDELIDLLAETGIWLPTTFPLCHKGPSETWTHATGKRSRIDYFMVSQHFSAVTTSTWVDKELDLLNVKDDHEPVAMSISLELAHSGRRPSTLDREKGYDPQKLRSPGGSPPSRTLA